MKCIYCLEDKNSSDFNTEHVMPVSFGKFENNFTLKDIVCQKCNSYFSNNLERYLGRDTIEGISRYLHKIKPVDKYKPVDRRIRIKAKDGVYKGATVYLKPSNGKLVAKHDPHVGFLKNSSKREYEWFPLEQIPPKDLLESRDYNLDDPESIRVLNCDSDRAEKLLQEKGVSFKIGGEKECPKDSNSRRFFTVQAEIDDIIFRAIAKIAFNYLAFWEGNDFVNRTCFDPIRRYIRTGENADYPLVHVTNKAILADELSEGIGHIITVNWAADGVSIIAQVSLFNRITYRISLARGFPGILRDIRKGHFFDPYNHEIYKLHGVQRLCRWSIDTVNGLQNYKMNKHQRRNP